ncbi:unnamed protein product [Allacma fusca]|uniref:C2H2-type domain-containing protein n=1 Tax=Allacma fusca TaxID=39272 RepID=A0A8J2K0K6_9HEXA|nr:unnamed protein product [Allacma fusca]
MNNILKLPGRLSNYFLQKWDITAGRTFLNKRDSLRSEFRERSTMASSMQEEEILNCPDCQLQALQQQQNQMPNNHEHMLSNTNQQLKDHVQPYQPSRSYDLTNQMESNDTRPNSDDVLPAYHGKDQLTNITTGAYKNPSSNLQTSQCPPVQNLQSSMAGTSLLLSVSSTANQNSSNMLPNSNPCLTSIPMDGCDVSGYCATCAVLDLPSNDKYYRSSISGHSVFPTMFYRQPPPIPGFSPIPDCGPWSNCNSNDFGPYTYSTYAQQTSSGDYYSACNLLPSTQSPTGPPENTNQAGTLSSCSFSFTSNNSLGNENQCLKKENGTPSHPKGFIDESANDDDDSVIPICISSSSEDTSDSGSFISQREVIVEDVDDEDGASVSMSLCNIDRNHKCAICQNLIMTDCPSPLVNIFENIHEDITAEDLDITVSSGDIEIGGIEDEVRDFHTKKSLPNGPQITFGRLSYLLSIPLTAFRAVFDLEDIEKIPDADSQSAALCSKCGKLANTIDSLEKQFRSNCITLKQCFQQQAAFIALKPVQIPDAVGIPSAEAQTLFPGTREQNSCSDPPEKISPTFSTCNFSRSVSKQTQTDPMIECSKECLLTFEAISGSNFPNSKLTSTKDTMTDYNDTLTTNNLSYSDGNNGGHLTSAQLLRDSQSPSSNTIIFNELNLTYGRMLGDNITLESGNQENFRTDSPMGNLNLGTDIHDFTCSFIPAISKEKELPEIFNSCNSPDDSSSMSLNSLEDSLPSKRSKLLCEECGKILGCRRTFENHLKRHHNDFTHKCQACLKGFANEATLAIHTRTHTGEKPFQCRQCNKSFAAKSNMISHEEICKQQISPGGDLMQSKVPLTNAACNQSSSQEKKLQCQKCGICFRLKSRLEQHKQKGCKAKVLECSHCSKKFSKRSEMKIHLLMHDGMKPYFCDICGISFSTKGNQIAHTRTHWVEKRFKCDICGKGFHRKQALQLHYNRHNGMKPYGCNICERKFYDPSNLQNHKKVHHKRSA